jgi:hypothetical protein
MCVFFITSMPHQIPVTIEDASVYPAIKSALKNIGYPKSGEHFFFFFLHFVNTVL